MRLLHTSDWHLGISSGPVSRGPDHDHFLRWLEGTLKARAIDALVIAGDVFDSMQPSSDALARYYAFLARVALTGVRHVVVVGGNHDSASRLDAPADILKVLKVHVVGGLSGAEERWERCLIPLMDPHGAVEAVAIAVPYVHEFRLGIRTTDLDRDATREAFRARFTELYARLADAAEARWPGAPLIATGHLTIGAARKEDYPHEIHQVGAIEGLPASILDPRIRYVALGHIHRSYPVDDAKRAWYSGSPVALSLPEARWPRRALLVEIPRAPEAEAVVETVDIPAPRALMELRGEPDALIEAIAALTWSEPHPPLLYGRVLADSLPSDLIPRIHEALGRFDAAARPALVELRQERLTPLQADEEAPPPGLQHLTPGEVFGRLLQSLGPGDTGPLEAAFAQLASASTEDLDAMIRDIKGGGR